MKKSEFYSKVKEAMRSLDIKENKKTYTVKELQDISNIVGVDMYYVMMYLQYGRIF